MTNLRRTKMKIVSRVFDQLKQIHEVEESDGTVGIGFYPNSRAQMQLSAFSWDALRPPMTIDPTAPSSSGMATISVVSIGVRPCVEDCHPSRLWNSVTQAER